MNNRMGSLLARGIVVAVVTCPRVSWGQDRPEETVPVDPAAPLEDLAVARVRPAVEAEDDDRPALRPTRATPAGVGMSREVVRQIPGALDDPARAIEVLPGRSWVVSGMPHAFVRGAPPDNTGYYLDGIRLPFVHHFGVGPGAFPASLVDRVDYYAGAAPAHFGRAAGAVIALEPAREPDQSCVDASLRLFDAGASAQSPFANGRGRARVGARYAYSAALASLASDEYTGWYGDYHARASYDLSSSDQIGLFALGSHDDLDQKTRSGTEPVITTQLHRLDLRYDRRAGKDTRVRAAIQVGYDRAGGIDEQYVTDKSKAARVEVAHRLGHHLMLWWGGDVQVDSYVTENAETSDENYGAFLVDRDDRTLGAYLSASYRPAPEVEANWGIRADAYRSLGVDELAVDPRGSVRVGVLPRARVIGAAGVAHQPPSVLIPIPGVRVAGLAGGLQKTVQASGGVEVDVTPDIWSTLVGFRHWHRNTSDFLGTLTTPWHIPEVGTRTDGETTGAELTVQGRVARGVHGYLAYTLSRSLRRYKDRSFVASFDRTHVVTALATVDLGNRWHVGGRLTVVSGVPRSDPAAIGTENESDRLGVFFRLDGRAEKQWVLAGKYPVTAYAEVMNLTANREHILSDCEESGCLATEAFTPIIVPNLGAEIGF